MNIAQRNQLKTKQRLAAGEKVTVAAPDYGKTPIAKGINAAQRHQLKVLAKQTAEQASQVDSPENQKLNQEYDIIKASLEGDLVTLKGLNTTLKKLEHKAHIIPNYLDYLQQYKAAGHNHPNAILSQLVVWLFDCQQFDNAFTYANLAIEQGQKLPARFTTPNFETFICDQLFDYATAQLNNKQPAPALDFAMQGIDSGWDVNKIVKGKVFAVAGKLALADKKPQDAHQYWTKAIEFNDKAGVKKLLKELTIKLAKASQ